MSLIKCVQALKQFAVIGSTNCFRIPNLICVANLHSLTSSLSKANNTLVSRTQNFLYPSTTLINPVCGMKVKGRVRKRCHDCYILFKDHRVYNFCKTYPKHKQMSIRGKDKEYFIYTERTHGRIRKY